MASDGHSFFFEYEVVPGITLVKELKEQGRDLVSTGQGLNFKLISK